MVRSFLAVAVITVVAAALYFIPTIVASSRHHRNSTAIFALNLLLGWSIIGWVGALVWALVEQERLPATRPVRRRPPPPPAEALRGGAAWDHVFDDNSKQ